jgi:hypothetical protein
VKAYPEDQPRGVPARKAPANQVGSRVVAAVVSKHVAKFAKADVGSVAPATRSPAPKTARVSAPVPPPSAGTFGHATIPSRFQAGASSAGPRAAGAVPTAKNREIHPASAPHPPHSKKPNRR